MKTILYQSLLGAMLLTWNTPSGIAQNGVWEASVSVMPTNKIWAHSGTVVDDTIYILGGYEQFAKNRISKFSNPMILAYSPSSRKWQIKPTALPTPRGYGCVAELDGDIYFMSGWGDVKQFFSVFDISSLYHTKVNTWDETLKPLSFGRYGSAACSLGGKIYVMGGIVRSENAMRKIEVLDPLMNSWEIKRDMISDRAYFSIHPIYGKIYAIGGSSNEHKKPLRSMEVYDPEADEWDDTLADLPNENFQFGSVVYRDRIYVFGGRTTADTSYLTGEMYDAVLMYDPATDIWQQVSVMPRARAGCTAHVIQDKIYVIGGYDSTVDPGNSLHAWFPEIDVYTPVKEPIYAINIQISKAYVNKDTGSLHIQSGFVNHKNYRFTAIASCMSPDGRYRFSTHLLDDGLHGDGEANDGIYGGDLSEIPVESHFKVRIITSNLDLGEQFITLAPTNTFTTLGPMDCERVIRVKNQQTIHLLIRNHGSAETVRNIRAEVFTEDDCIVDSDKILEFPDAAPGKSVLSNNSIQLAIQENCAIGKSIKLHIAISSDGVFYWNDVVEVRIKDSD